MFYFKKEDSFRSHLKDYSAWQHIKLPWNDIMSSPVLLLFYGDIYINQPQRLTVVAAASTVWGLRWWCSPDTPRTQHAGRLTAWTMNLKHAAWKHSPEICFHFMKACSFVDVMPSQRVSYPTEALSERCVGWCLWKAALWWAEWSMCPRGSLSHNCHC